MSDRQQLLSAIHEAGWGNHTLRLAYADYLDEYGEGDVDAATSEFIRASCSGAKESTVMPRLAYGWIRRNWKRLIPSVLALHMKSDNEGTLLSEIHGPIHDVNGRTVWMRIRLPNPRHGPGRVPSYLCSCEFIFWKGFAVGCQCWSDFIRASLKDAIKRDQPLCVFDRKGKPVEAKT